MMTVLPYQTLLDNLNENTIVLTPNRRLAATLHKLYQEKQEHNNLYAWKTPVIIPAATWIQLQWETLQNNPDNTLPLLLNTVQESVLWEEVVNQITERSPLLRTSEAALAAKSAWQLMQQWQASFDDARFDSSPDYQAFKQFAQHFKMLCEKNNWIDQASIVNFLIDYSKKNSLTIAKKIILVGFTEVSPQLSTLFETLHAHVEPYQLKREHTAAFQLCLSTPEDELITLAHYAKSCYEKNKTLKQGFVVPSLDKIRDRVAQVFSSVFKDETAFNISAGKSLTHYPIIHAALTLLSLNTKTFSSDTLSYLLHSPFLGDAEREQSARATTDIHLHQRNLRNLSQQQLFQYLNHCSLLTKRLKKFFDHLETLPSHQSHTAWMQHFVTLLTLLGWPGERSMNSHEFQVTDHFIKTLETLYSLDLINDSITYLHALQTLQKTLTKTVFQPKTPDAPIQVLGTLEALGLPFDQLWISGMDDLSWPEQPKPNPFIPKSMQRELNMPRATALRELAYCKEMTEQFKHSAEHVIFSYAKKQDDVEMMASPLIRDLTPFVLPLEPDQTQEQLIFASKKWEYIHDETAPPISEHEKIAGGSGILKDQALCPFKAFTKWRLHANDIEKTTPGLNAKERGNLLHLALDLFWKKYRDHYTLINLSNTELHEAIQECVQNAILSSENNPFYSANYLELEAKRLRTLLLDWLTIEKEREPFVVANTEMKSALTIGALTYHIRIDRIDQLQNGHLFIVDYKSGKNNSTYSWMGTRPDEPQLPLYALIHPAETSGIAFAQIATGALEFKGITQSNITINGCKQIDHWAQQINDWQMVLTSLSNDFSRGHAAVDPKEPPATCQWCHYKPFCRINEDITS